MANVPGVGKVPKGWVIGVGVISAVVIGYAYMKHKNSAAAATTSSTAPVAPVASGGDQYPPDGTSGDPTDPNSTDPATGMTYGDEALYGGGSGGYGTGGFAPSGGGYYPGTGGSGGVQGPGSFTTNADWSQYAQQQLSGIVDAGALSSALGVYLTGSAASAAQVTLIDQAIAVAGYPPVAGAGNFPPNIKQGGSQPGGGGVTGLHASARFDNLTATWNPVSGATGYTWSVTEHQGAQTVASGTTTGTSVTARGLKQKTGYAVHVTPQPGGTPAVTYVTTQ